MTLKYVNFMNTLLLIVYISLPRLTNQEDFFAILTVLIFAFGILTALFSVVIFSPVKLKFNHYAILFVRLGIFLSVPLQEYMFLHIASVAVIFTLDFWQFKNGEVDKRFRKKEP